MWLNIKTVLCIHYLQVTRWALSQCQGRKKASNDKEGYWIKLFTSLFYILINVFLLVIDIDINKINNFINVHCKIGS